MMAALDALIAEERLPPDYGAMVEHWWRPLAARIADWHAAARRPLVIGINGAQGSGKTTLCRFLETVLLPEFGLSAVTVSLDDLYLPLAERLVLAQDVHPLLRTRGVPGTHDAGLGAALLDDLAAGRDAWLLRFSKALDDRLPRAGWIRHRGPVDIILFEGWCVGATAQETADLATPINALEGKADPDGIWRRYVNDALAGPYADLFARIDRLVMLRPPDFASVVRNRLLQEARLRDAAPGAPGIMNEAGVQRFVSHYERLTRHMFAELPARADVLFALDARQGVASMALGLGEKDMRR